MLYNYGIMLKYLAALIVVLGMAFIVARQDQHAADQAAQKAAELHKATPPTKPDEQHPQENVENPAGDSPRWYILCLYGLFRWPNGTTTWAIILTLLALSEQTQQTRKAAEASAKQAEIAKTALVSSFRPKIVLRSITLNPPNLAAYHAANDGIWKIDALLVNEGGTKAMVETCELEFVWDKDDPVPWVKKITPICTEVWNSFVIPPAARHPLQVSIPYDTGFGGTFDLIVQMLDKQNSLGQHEWPTCRGKIVYVDGNGHWRQTGFYRKWNIPDERFQRSDDPEFEYQD